MAGGLLQLVAKGAQDIYLTDNPQITFFKVSYKKYTNFSIESIPHVYKGMGTFGNKITFDIQRKGDLITNAHLEVRLPAIANAGWVDHIGYAMIDKVELELGGQVVDEFDGNWLYIQHQLTTSNDKEDGHNIMIGNVDELKNSDAGVNDYTLYIPLRFFFSKHSGLALPIVALQYHDIKIHITLKNINQLAFITNGDAYVGFESLAQCVLYIDYIYLDMNERRRFAQNSHEYLIEQVQTDNNYSVSYDSGNIMKNMQLTFNHPVKELIWCLRINGNTPDVFNFTNKTRTVSNGDYDKPVLGYMEEISKEGPLINGQLYLNGHERFSKRSAKYFNYVQPYYHHTNIPVPGIYSYSFAMKPENYQPSGTLNMSRVDNATLNLEFQGESGKTANINMYAVNYNILRIVGGMGGIAYSN